MQQTSEWSDITVSTSVSVYVASESPFSRSNGELFFTRLRSHEMTSHDYTLLPVELAS